MRERIGVIGGGSWGTALAKLLAEKGYPVALWVHDPGHCREMWRTPPPPVSARPQPAPPRYRAA